MDEKTLVQIIYKNVSKSTYNKYLSSTINKLLHPFPSILPLYICVSIYNFIRIGSRSRYVACKINTSSVISLTQIIGTIFRKIHEIKTTSLTWRFAWFVKESDPLVCLLMEP